MEEVQVAGPLARPSNYVSFAHRDSGRLQNYTAPQSRQLAQYRPMEMELKRYIDALAGPTERTPLIYTGDPMGSLDRLHQDVVSHYRELSTALGEHERRDLTADPSHLSGYGQLSLGAAPSSLMLTSALSHCSYGAAGRDGLHPPHGSFLSPGIGSHGLQSLLATPYRSRLRPGVASAPVGALAARAAAMRASGFALGEAEQVPDSLLVNASSQLMYPPVGSTFDGHASQNVEAVRRAGGIDSLADLNYRRKPALQYSDILQEATAQSIPRSHRKSEYDQLDSFLADYVKGKAQPDLPPSFALSRPNRGHYFRM